MSNDKTILVIDDDKNIRDLLSLELGDLGYKVLLAQNGFEGIQAIKNKDIDLVILDIKMPGMDGIEALEKIISIKRELPVVIHSAYSHYKENYLTWSAMAYVVKSGNLKELISTVQKLLN